MNTLSLAVLVVLAGLATTAMAQDKPHYPRKDAEKWFEKFIKDYDRHYKDEADKKVHFEAFKKSMREVNVKNKKDSAIYDIDKFADYTDEEWGHINGIPNGNNP